MCRPSVAIFATRGETHAFAALTSGAYPLRVGELTRPIKYWSKASLSGPFSHSISLDTPTPSDALPDQLASQLPLETHSDLEAEAK